MQPRVLYALTTESSVNFLTEIIELIIPVAAVVALHVFIRLGILRYLAPKMTHILTIVYHLDGRLLVVWLLVIDTFVSKDGWRLELQL